MRISDSSSDVCSSDLPGGEQRKVRTGLRLGQIHGARPTTFKHGWDENRLLVFGAHCGQGFANAIGQQRAQQKCPVGRIDVFAVRRSNQPGQALSPPSLLLLLPLPPPLRNLTPTLLYTSHGPPP